MSMILVLIEPDLWIAFFQFSHGVLPPLYPLPDLTLTN